MLQSRVLQQSLLLIWAPRVARRIEFALNRLFCFSDSPTFGRTQDR